MQKLVIFLFVLLAFTACEKDHNVTPVDPAVAGTYVLSRLLMNKAGTVNDTDKKYPYTINGITYSGEVTVTQNTNSTDRATLAAKLKQTGAVDYEFLKLNDVELRRNGSNYELYFETIQIGTATGNEIMFDVTTKQSERFIVEAHR